MKKKSILAGFSHKFGKKRFGERKNNSKKKLIIIIAVILALILFLVFLNGFFLKNYFSGRVIEEQNHPLPDVALRAMNEEAAGSINKESLGGIEIETEIIQYGAVLGELVKWKRVINLSSA